MKANNNNGLGSGALLSLYVTSYMPLFLIVIVKQLDIMDEEPMSNTTLYKKLVKLQQIGGLANLDAARIKKI